MVKLTEEMIVSRTRISDFSAITKLNFWGSELRDVSILRKLENVELLSLSVNNIETLADFQYCRNLRSLYIRNNEIKDLNEICYLQELPKLKNLWLGENPCAGKDGYRLTVLRTLPNLEMLDNEVVSAKEVQTALSRGRVLVHPLDMDACPPQSEMISPEEVPVEYIEETRVEKHRKYSSSSDQRSYDKTHTQEEYHDSDRRNANCKTSLPHHYAPSNQYTYELHNGQSKSQNKDENMCTESRNYIETLATNTLDIPKDSDDQPGVSRHNGDYDERRSQYGVRYETQEDNRFDRNNYEYDDKRQIECDESLPQPSSQHRRMPTHHSTEREDTSQVPGWVRHSDKEKCRPQFHYHRRPVTRNSNILSAVLCLVKELDYPSLEVVEMAVRNRMDELEE